MKFMAYVVYCSPAGTTRHLGEVLVRSLEGTAERVVVCELGRRRSREEEVLADIAEASGRVVVFVGSPVYSSHALPLVMDFIARLPRRPEAYAVPFVTWGGATSGLALSEMGMALGKAGCGLVGAAKVVAVHSLMWEADEPLAAGHPDSEDDRLVGELAATVAANLLQPRPRLLDPAVLDYQPAAAAAVMARQNLALARQTLPARKVDESCCNGCGVCVESCPVGALVLDPLPVCDENRCIVCFNCVRLCPERAFAVDLGPIHEHIRQRAAHFAEKPLSEIFLAGRGPVAAKI